MADTKISDMTAATELDRADLVAVVQDVATTPVNKSATLDVLDSGNVLGGIISDADSVAVNDGAETQSAACVAIGDQARARQTRSVAIGAEARPHRGDSVAVGWRARTGTSFTDATSVTLIGSQAETTSSSADRAVAVGYQATVGHEDSVALGAETTTTATDQVMVGPRDIEITGTDKGLVLEDRTLGTRHRVYLDDGALEIEAA